MSINWELVTEMVFLLDMIYSRSVAFSHLKQASLQSPPLGGLPRLFHILIKSQNKEVRKLGFF